MLSSIYKDLEKAAKPGKVKILSSFFKTGPGQYGEGDKFLGITVPDQRKVAKKYAAISIKDLSELISSKMHEHRLTALLILAEKYKKDKKTAFDFYIDNIRYVNNWDLVDLTAPNIVGAYLHDKNRSLLYKFAHSRNLWERRIAILATFYYIKQGEFNDTFKIVKILLKDKHDLIHKAIGWMLREIGKRNDKIEKQFLDKHYKIMPRTALRYAIERFNDNTKKKYMQR